MKNRRNYLSITLFTLLIAVALLITSGCYYRMPGNTPEERYKALLFKRLEQSQKPEIDVQISLTRFLTPSQIQDLLSKPGAPSANELYILIPEIWDGYRTMLPVDPDADLSNIAPFLLRKAEVYESHSQKQAALIRSAAESPNITIPVIRGKTTPENAISWWKENQELVRLIQVYVSDDRSILPYEPGVEIE